MHLRVAVPPPPPRENDGRGGGNVDENLTQIVFCDVTFEGNDVSCFPSCETIILRNKRYGENIIRVCMGIFTLRSKYNNTSHFYCALLVV